MKFGIDVRWMNNNRGMARFAEFFIKPLKKEIIALAPNNIGDTSYQTVKKGNSFFPWWEQYILPILSKQEALDFLILPYNTGPIFGNTQAKQIAVIHDLIFMRSRKELPLSMSLYQTLGRYYRRFVVPRVAKKADIIVTVSEYTKSELIEKLNVPADKIRVIPNSIENDWFVEPIPLTERKPYLFTVTGSAPSKNVPNLLKAFSIAKNHYESNFMLRIAGINTAHHATYITQAKALGIEHQVEFLGFISDQELQLQYRQARAFVFASLFEGFGIPLLEAMASGTPVCCSNSTSLPEVVGDTALLFDPTDIADIANNLVLVLADKEAKLRTVAAYKRATEFSEDAVNKKIKTFWREFCDFDC
jgi:glycosyltransferase involved in cell wall biosynthesis